MDSTDPSITVRLAPPNETFTSEYISNGDGTIHGLVTDFSAPYTWQELSVEPDHSSYLVSAPAGFDNCDASIPAGQVCARQYNVWGNAATLFVSASSAVWNGPLIGIQITESLVPEPQSWALMIAGFGAAGAMLRRVRRARAALA